MIKKWQKFLESSEVEFPLKKYTSIVRDKILNRINPGNNQITFDFKDNEYGNSTNITINIEWIKSENNHISGQTDILHALRNEFTEFIINITIECIDIDYNNLISTIQHELKHVYDILYDDSEENTFLKVEPLNRLKRKFKKFDNFYEFIHLVYESLKHELDARNVSIYDKFRWLGIYDKSIISSEFQKTYVYKSLTRLSRFNHLEFISSFKENELIDMTNEFIEIYSDDVYKISSKSDLIDFYKFWESEFHEKSKKYLHKAEKVIDDIILDIRPYMEAKLTTTHINFNTENSYEKLFISKLNLIYKT
jgi:hypothetical protein